MLGEESLVISLPVNGSVNEMKFNGQNAEYRTLT